MATMYSLFFGLFFTALCSDNGDGSGVLVSLKPGEAHTFLLDQESTQRTGTKWSSTKLNSSLKPRSALRSKTFDTKEVHPRAIVKNLPPVSSQARFVGDKLRECKVFALACTPIKAVLMSPVNIPVFKDDLLAYGIKDRKATNSISEDFALEQDLPSVNSQARFHCKTINNSTPLQSGLLSPVKLLTIAEGCTTVQSKGSSGKAWTLGRYQVSRPSGMEDKRNLIIAIASEELGTSEATGNNDGPRIEQYLRYTNLGKGYEWCSAYVSWVYGQAGFAVPRNPWSPALFPKARQIDKVKAMPADVFGIYGVKAKRINHVGLVKEKLGQYLVTIEGNSNDRVESRRRHLRTIYAIADWAN
ncbi:hypothetical protein SAMN05660841_00896 [Sphingobacterium nematocida]|uniref:CHAP domain-containing protein n=1 Tax=Sphingobacterium nematocida TaxID=1513896 RepID=A0A1T5BR40_9SPHI|nr:hypothetical protein [Sphingobacterium nematocida]SKB49852.1 hypothetical protein SAMN05660841_00896 [Sphingobacterium nematocida]